MLMDVNGLDFDKISIGVTHTHNSSDYFSDFLREDNEHVFGKEILPPVEMGDDVLYGKKAQMFLAETSCRRYNAARGTQESPAELQPHTIMQQWGFPAGRCFRGKAGDKTIMYGDCSREDFLRFEGGTDSSADMLYTFDQDGRLSGIAVNVPCPSQVFELHHFITAGLLVLYPCGHPRGARQRICVAALRRSRRSFAARSCPHQQG